jgi:tripartite-type tricarboxylate transporter receptor subunit TctC
MPVTRRSLLALGALAAPAVAPRIARAQAALPQKDVRILVGFEAGGGADVAARAVATELQRRLSVHVHVENRTGSYGAMPGEIAKKGPADGTTLALLSSTTLVSKLASRDFPFDPVNDLAPVTEIGTFAIAFAVSPTIAVDSFEDYLQWLKAGDDRRRRIAVSSNTAFVQVLNNLLRLSIGETLEPVSYRGAVPIVNDLQDGRIPASVNTITSLLPAHRGRRIRILMTTSARRLAMAPNIPTAIELGYPKLDMKEWFAFFVSAKTPEPVVAAWNRELRRVIETPEVADTLKPLGLEIRTSSPDAMPALIEAHRKAWERRMQAVGMQPVN